MAHASYSDDARWAVMSAQAVAKEHHSRDFRPAHLLYALLSPSTGTVAEVLRRLGLDRQVLLDALRPHLEGEGAGAEATLTPTPAMDDAEARAASEMRQRGGHVLEREDLLLGLLTGNEAAEVLLRDHGLTPVRIREVLQEMPRREAPRQPGRKRSWLDRLLRRG